MDSNVELITSEIIATIKTLRDSLESDLSVTASQVAEAIFKSMSNGGKLLLAGNGGSAADAQHMAAEFVNYFSYPRKALPAIALTTDTSVLTSISNDTDFSTVFSRQIEALGKPGDVVWLYTTSGSSKNIVAAAKTAKTLGLIVICFTGNKSDLLSNYADFIISVPSDVTPKIQEVHLVLGHAISGFVENRFFGSK